MVVYILSMLVLSRHFLADNNRNLSLFSDKYIETKPWEDEMAALSRNTLRKPDCLPISLFLIRPLFSTDLMRRSNCSAPSPGEPRGHRKDVCVIKKSGAPKNEVK